MQVPDAALEQLVSCLDGDVAAAARTGQPHWWGATARVDMGALDTIKGLLMQLKLELRQDPSSQERANPIWADYWDLVRVRRAGNGSGAELVIDDVMPKGLQLHTALGGGDRTTAGGRGVDNPPSTATQSPEQLWTVRPTHYRHPVTGELRALGEEVWEVVPDCFDGTPENSGVRGQVPLKTMPHPFNRMQSVCGVWRDVEISCGRQYN
jgi:hypothetical protein